MSFEKLDFTDFFVDRLGVNVDVLVSELLVSLVGSYFNEFFHLACVLLVQTHGFVDELLNSIIHLRENIRLVNCVVLLYLRKNHIRPIVIMLELEIRIKTYSKVTKKI